jgi:hypothetical protein
MFWRWCAACGQRPVFSGSTVLCRMCHVEMELELEALDG